VHLINPDPMRTVRGITLSAPPAAAPGLLFLAVTVEPAADASEFGKADQ